MDGASHDVFATAGVQNEIAPLTIRQPFMGELQRPLLPQKFVLCRCTSRLEALDFDEMLGLNFLSLPFPGRPFHFGFGVLGGFEVDEAPEYLVQTGDYLALRLVTIARKIKKEKIEALLKEAVKDAQEEDGQKMITADINILEARLISLALKKAPPSFDDVMLVYHRPSGLMMVGVGTAAKAARICKMLDKVMPEWRASPILASNDASDVLHAWRTGDDLPARTRLAPVPAKASKKSNGTTLGTADETSVELDGSSLMFEFDGGLKLSVTRDGVFGGSSLGLPRTKSADPSPTQQLAHADIALPASLHLLQSLGTRVPLLVQPCDYWDAWAEAEA